MPPFTAAVQALPPPVHTVERAPDRGPIYTETDFSHTIVEPYNALSAALFLVVVIYWTRVLWGRFAQHRFLAAALPVLTIGAVGGTLYHALRMWRGFLIMDYMPILLLALAAGVYFLRRLLGSLLAASGLVIVWFSVQGCFFYAVRHGYLAVPLHVSINLSYALLGLLVAGPIAAYLLRVDRQHAWRFAIALCAFAAGLSFRYLDALRPPLLPMGTHFLWHLCGALAVYQCFALIYAVERPVPHAAPTEP